MLLSLAILNLLMPVNAPAQPSLGSLKSLEAPGPLVHNVNSFQHDNRKELLEKSAPWSAVGKLFIPASDKPGTYDSCTASLVGPDLILTNAHCVLDRVAGREEGTLIKGGYRFEAQYRAGKSIGGANITKIWVGTHAPWTEIRNDWALLRLDRRLGDDLGWFGVKEVSGDDLQDLHNTNYIYMAGYSRDFKNAQAPAWQKDCRFTQFFPAEKQLTHNCSGVLGASGSPMFVFKEAGSNEGFIVALHVAEIPGVTAKGKDKMAKYRQKGTGSLLGIPYSDEYGNAAIPAEQFLPTLQHLRQN
jgi:V8-like Glu-specific endopeptidase